MTGIGASLKKHQRAIGIGMAAMGTAILSAAALSVKQFAQMGDEIQKMALRTGFSTEALSELRHAADLSGASLAGLEKASRTLSGAILDAGYGLETYVRSFDQLGLSYEDLAKLSPEDQFLAVMEALAKVEDESTRAALATDLFGRAGTQLLPMLSDGAEGLEAMRKEAHDLGIVFDQEAANKAAAFNDALTKLKGSMTGVMLEIGSLIVDYIKPLVDKITEIIKKYIEWRDEHPLLSDAIEKTTLALGALLLVVGTAIVLKIPQLIVALIALKAVVWAHVTALWAQVSATLAAIAATGAGIPVAIAAIAAIGLLVASVVLLEKRQREQAGTTKAVTEATDAMAISTEVATKATHTLGQEVQVLTRIEAARLRQAKEMLSIMGRLFPGGFGEKEWAAWREAGLLTPQAIRGFQAGGIITRPTLALLGEQAPRVKEYVFNEHQLGMIGRGSANIYVELDGRVIAKAVGQPLVDEIRLRTGVKI